MPEKNRVRCRQVWCLLGAWYFGVLACRRELLVGYLFHQDHFACDRRIAGADLIEI
jgi:hypothetical protein